MSRGGGGGARDEGVGGSGKDGEREKHPAPEVKVHGRVTGA